MKKVRNFKNLKSGILYTNTNQDTLYFLGIMNKEKLAIFIKEMVDENQDTYYIRIYLDKDEIKKLRYDL